jgi:hypothetical protein
MSSRKLSIVLLTCLVFTALAFLSFSHKAPYRPIDPEQAHKRLGFSELPLPEQAYVYTGKDFGIWARWRVAPEALNEFLLQTGLKDLSDNTRGGQEEIMIAEMKEMNQLAKEASPFYPPAISVRSFGMKEFKFPNYISILIGEDRSPGAPAGLSVFIFKNF